MADKHTRWRIEVTENLSETNKKIERLLELQQEGITITQQSAAAATAAINQQKTQIDNLTTAQTKHNTTTATGSKQQADAVGTLRKEYDLLSKQLSGIVNLAAGAWAVGQLKTYVMEVINAKSAQDGFVASMEQMLGSRLKAEELNAKLMAIATKSPFTIEQVQEVTKKLQGMGVETEKLIPYVNMLGDIAAVVGTQKLPLIAKALTDVQNKGILMGQEIKQFTENGIPLFDLLAKSMGKPREEITKLANDHKIAFADVEKALMNATEKGGLYYNQMAVQAEQLGGKVANLSDKFTLGLAKVGDYFEKGIKKGIETLSNFIDATIGSVSAMDRTIKVFEVAASAYALYRIAVLSVNASLKANQVETLAALAAKEADTVATVAMTTSTTGLRAAMTGLWTAMRANPIGAVITLVTALYTAYQLWELSTMDVVSALGEEEIKLKNSQALMVGSVEYAMKLAEGTQERTKAINQLIQKYPDYFSGLNAEKTNNQALKNILDSINISYAQRIDLARQAYVISELDKKRSELLKDEFELMEHIKNKSPELYAQVQGDSQKLLDAINKGGNTFMRDLESKGSFLRDLWFQVTNGGGGLFAQVRDVAEGLKKVDTEIIQASQRRAGIAEQEQKAAIAIENARWVEVEKQLKKGTKDYENAHADHLKKIGDMDGVVAESKITLIDKVDKKKKSSLELSLENDIAELKSVQQTYMVKLQLLEKQADLEMEHARRTISNQQDLSERILSIKREYQLKAETLMMSEIEKRMDYDMKDLKKQEDHAAKMIQIEQDKWDQVQDIGSEVMAIMQKTMDDDRAEQEQKEKEATQRRIDRMKETASLIMSAMSSINNLDSEIMLRSIDRATEAVHAFYDGIKKANEDSFEEQIKNTSLSMGQIQAIFEEYAERQRMVLSNTQAFDSYSEKMRQMVQESKEMAEESSKFTSLLAEGKWVGAIISGITSVIEGFKKGKEMKQQEAMEIRANDIANLELEKQLIDDQLRAQTAAIQAQYDRKMEKLNAYKDQQTVWFEDEIARTKAHYADLLALEQQKANDSKNLINASTAYRNELADAWVVREVAALEAERDRNLKRAKSDEDYQETWNYYAGLINDAHNKYENSKTDKSIQTAIANEELAAQSADAITKNKEEETNAINDLQGQLEKSMENIAVAMYNAQRKMNEAMVQASKDAANAKMEIESRIFEANKAMALAELDFELRKVLSKLNPNGAQAAMIIMQIEELKKVQNPFTSVGAGGISDQSGSIRVNSGKSNITNNYQDPGVSIPDKNGGKSNQEPPSTGGGRGREPGFHGSPWLKRTMGEKYGLDEILMNVHEGERLIPSYLNQFLGPKLTNEALVQGFLSASFLDRLPSTEIPVFPEMVLPDFSVSKSGNDSMLNDLKKEIKELNNTFSNKSLLNVNIDANNVTISEQWNNHKANYYETIFTK